MNENAVGIIANPASGKDIRRIVTYSSPYDNQEKVNIIRRICMALHACGIRKIYYMPEYYNIIPQAINGIFSEHAGAIGEMEFIPLDFIYLEEEEDSTKAGAMLLELGVKCIITLGGDGTNRAVAKGCGDTPIIPVSSGTNNVFPSMIEGTIAGLAAGVVANGIADNETGVLEHRKRIELIVDGELADMALIDMVFMEDGQIGARAMWNADDIRQLFVTECAPYNIGISAIAGQYETIMPADDRGMYIEVDKDSPAVMAAIAPGIICPVGIKRRNVINVGDVIVPESRPYLVAVDGERNTRIKAGQRIAVKLSSDGPVVVNIQKAMSAAADKGFFMQK